MTRETKIGMLVGLAFIIVIGILLSDHMTSTTEPAKAPLSSAGSEVRSGVTTPAAAPVANAAAAVQAPGSAPPGRAPGGPRRSDDPDPWPTKPSTEMLPVGRDGAHPGAPAGAFAPRTN